MGRSGRFASIGGEKNEKSFRKGEFTTNKTNGYDCEQKVREVRVVIIS
jgi:hypothetical protein